MNGVEINICNNITFKQIELWMRCMKVNTANYHLIRVAVELPHRIVVRNHVPGWPRFKQDRCVGTFYNVVFNQAGAGFQGKVNVGIMRSGRVQICVREIAIANFVMIAPIHLGVIAVRVVRFHTLDPAVRASGQAKVCAIAGIVGIYLKVLHSRILLRSKDGRD